jgi:hypothetical protein
MKIFTKKNIKAASFEYVPMILGIRVPGFLRIHFRYALRNPFIWMILVIAPFILGMMFLSALNTQILDGVGKGWQIFLITLFLIALAFFMAERSRKFRRFYVAAIPGMVIANGLFNLFIVKGFNFGNLIVFIILAGIPAWILGKFSMGYGYRMLSDGAYKNYRIGRNLYMDGDYKNAFIYLEPAARKGHMKSLYLLGHAHEHENGRELDPIKAARFYEKASSKGYGKASRAYEALVQTFTPDQMQAYETDISTLEVNQLF